MKIVLKLLATPVVMILTVFIGLCVVLLHISALILGLAGTVVALLGLAVLITYSVKNGIILLVIAFLLSPFGLPMLAVRVLGLLQETCRKTGRTVIVITHNTALTAMADRVIQVRSGQIVSNKVNEHPVPVEEIEW